MSFIQKTKGGLHYFSNLKEKDARDHKQFWRTVKPLLSGKIKSSEKISDKGDSTISEDKKNSMILNKFFSSAVKT